MDLAKLIILILVSFTVLSQSSQECIKLNTSEYTVAGFKMIEGKWHAFVDDQHYAPENLHEAMEGGRKVLKSERHARVFLARPWHVYFFYIQKNSTLDLFDDLYYIFFSDPDPSRYPKSPTWRSGLVPKNSYDVKGRSLDYSYPSAKLMILNLFMRADELNRFHYFGWGKPYGENKNGEEISYGCWPLPWSSENNASIPRLNEDCCKGDKNSCLPDIGTGKYYTHRRVFDESDTKYKEEIDFMMHCNGFVNGPLETSELTVYYWEHEDSPERSSLCFDIGFKPSFAVEIYRKAWALPDENGKFVYGCKSILPDEQRTISTVPTTNASTKIASENPENVTTESPNNNKAEMISSSTPLVYSLVLGTVFWMPRFIKNL